MNSASNHTDFSFTCPICLDDDGITTGQSAGYTLVGTSCQPKPHVFHLGCITKWLDGEQQQGKRLDQRQCCECRQPALPLVRLNGSRTLTEESPYCESLILHACRTGDLKTLNMLLALDASLATRTYRSARTGQPAHPLAIAIDSGHMDCAQTLIDHQADVNAADQDGQTPLHLAAENGNIQCLKLLVTHGASVNATNKNGETPLHMATKIGIIEARQQWAAMGRNIDESFDNGRMLERYTSKKENNTGFLKELLANSEVNINTIDNDSVTPLMIAALWGKSERLKWLLEAGADINVIANWDWMAIHFAAISGCAESVKVLLAVPGIKVSESDIFGWTVLHLAAGYDCAESLKVLLATSGIRVNKRNGRGWTALHIAAKYDSAESVKTLLVAPGIQVNKKTNKGKTALHIAAKYRSTESIKTLLAAPGIRVNKKTYKGWTALHIAAMYGNAECLEALLAAPGIHIKEQTDDGWTALSLAASHGHSACIELLIVNGAWLPIN